MLGPPRLLCFAAVGSVCDKVVAEPAYLQGQCFGNLPGSDMSKQHPPVRIHESYWPRRIHPVLPLACNVQCRSMQITSVTLYDGVEYSDVAYNRH